MSDDVEQSVNGVPFPRKSIYQIERPEEDHPLTIHIQGEDGPREILRLDSQGKLTVDPENTDEAARLFVNKVAQLTSLLGSQNVFKGAYTIALEEELATLRARMATFEENLKKVATEAIAMGMVWENLAQKGGGELGGVPVSKDVAIVATTIANDLANKVLMQLAIFDVQQSQPVTTTDTPE